MRKQITEKIKLERWQHDILEDYCGDDMRKMKKILYPIFRQKYVPQFEMEDLCGDMIDVLLDSVVRFDREKKVPFEPFFISNVKKKTDTWLRDSGRGIRSNVELNPDGTIKKDERGFSIKIQDKSFDVELDDGSLLAEKIDSGRSVEDDLECKEDFSLEKTIAECSKDVQEYLNGLSKAQRKVLELVVRGYGQDEIVVALNISPSLYKDCMAAITSCRNTRKIQRMIRRY